MVKYLVFVCITCLISSCGSEQKNSDITSTVARPAKLLTITPKLIGSYLNYPATIQSQNTSSLSFEVSGVVKELKVVASQKVKKGDVLAILDSRDLKAQYESAKAQFASANSDYERALRLIKEDAISKSELEQRKSKKDINKASLVTAEKALKDTELIAPFAGNVAEIIIKEQQAVQASETAIVLLGDGLMEATINLPSSIMAKAQKQPENANSSYVSFSFSPNQKFPATFKEVELNADVNSQTYQVSFTFESPSNLNILPGMNATLWFRDPSIKNASIPKISIPLTAIGIENNKKYVWLVDQKTMMVNKKHIEIENNANEEIVVLSGLQTGDVIVMAGISSLYKDMKVRAWSNN